MRVVSFARIAALLILATIALGCAGSGDPEAPDSRSADVMPTDSEAGSDADAEAAPATDDEPRMPEPPEAAAAAVVPEPAPAPTRVEPSPEPVPPSPPAAAVERNPRVALVQFTTEIQNREPVDAVTFLGSEAGEIFFYSDLRDLAGATVVHRWEYQGEVVAEVPFDVRGDRWRVWSSKSLRPEWIGDWTVSVVAPDGEVLAVETFSYEVAR